MIIGSFIVFVIFLLLFLSVLYFDRRNLFLGIFFIATGLSFIFYVITFITNRCNQISKYALEVCFDIFFKTAFITLNLLSYIKDVELSIPKGKLYVSLFISEVSSPSLLNKRASNFIPISITFGLFSIMLKTIYISTPISVPNFLKS